MRPVDYFGFVIFFGWLAGLCIHKAYKSEVMPTHMKVSVYVGAIIVAHYMVQICVMLLSP